MLVRVAVDLVGGRTREFVQEWRDDRTLAEIRDYLWLRVVDAEADGTGLVAFESAIETASVGTYRTQAIIGISVVPATDVVSAETTP